MRYPSSRGVARLGVVWLGLLGLVACAEASGPDTSPPVVEGVAIPTAAEWTYRGVAFTPGSTGQWDDRLTFGCPATMVKIGSTYYLYYIAASGARGDGGPAYRAVGLATSSDGITWTKHPNNPVIPWSQMNRFGDDEEGAWRAAAMLEDDGTVILYNTHLSGSGGSVGGHIFLWTSSDGVSFTVWDDPGSNWGEIIRASNSNYPGSDEYGVLGAAKSDAGLYHMQFTAKGSLNWDMVETSASTRDGFTSGSLMLNLANQIRYGSNPVKISPTEWIIPVGTLDGNIYIYRTSNLASIGTLATTYGALPSGPISGRGNFALYLDRAAGTWFLIVATNNGNDNFANVRVWTAPVTFTDGP